MSARRAAALGALVLGLAAIILAIVLTVEHFPRGLVLLICLWIALAAGWLAVRREGLVRLLAAALTSVALTAGILVLVLAGGLLLDLLVAALFALSILLARTAFQVRAELPAAPRPARPVLFFNPLSGGGKATRFRLAEEARRRGIEPIELTWERDLREIVEEAIGAGADALAMAGGDGSQAIVAEIAAARDLPYACIPAGTRNHFALDLGVDREDVVGALDAFIDGRERRVDLAEVNGRVFVNNVSLGIYAEAVQQEAYRDAKLRTLLSVAPTELGPEPVGPSLRWRDADGEAAEGALSLLVSNDVYRLGPGIGSGTRPRLDEGTLGIAAVTGAARPPAPPGPGLRQWSAGTFTVEGEGPVPAGIDGEAATLSPPIRFRSRPGALRVRIAAAHAGASPSAGVPRGVGAGALGLIQIAAGASPVVDHTSTPEKGNADGHVRG